MIKKNRVFEATFKIRYAVHYNGTAKILEDLINHHYSGIAINKATSEIKLVKDKRKLPKPPFPCNKCFWCKGRECWFEDEYYGEFDGDYETCFIPRKKGVDKDKVIEEYFRRFRESIGE